MGAKKGRRGAAAKTKGPGGVGTKASAREAKRKLIAAVRAGLAADAGGKALGEAFRSGFLEAGNYNQVLRVLQKGLREDKDNPHPINILDNRGHLMDIVNEAVKESSSCETPPADEGQPLGEARSHWEMLKAKKKAAVERIGGSEALQKMKDMEKAAKKERRARLAELRAKRKSIEMQAKQAKEERIKLKQKKHEALQQGLCIDFVQGKCPFGAKCNFKHPEDADEELAAANEAFAEQWQKERKRKDAEDGKAKGGKTAKTLGGADAKKRPPAPGAPHKTWRGAKPSRGVVKDGKKAKVRSSTGRHAKRAQAHAQQVSRSS